MKTDEFEFAETVNALSQVIGLTIASLAPDSRAAFVARINGLIGISEPQSIRWRLYRQVLRDAAGDEAEQSERF